MTASGKRPGSYYDLINNLERIERMNELLARDAEITQKLDLLTQDIHKVVSAGTLPPELTTDSH